MPHTRRAIVAGLAATVTAATPAATLAPPMSEGDRIMAGYGADLAAIRARVELVAKALELPASEVEWAMSDPEGQSLILFAHQYGQDMDWLFVGDLRATLRVAWRRHGADPDIRLPGGRFGDRSSEDNRAIRAALRPRRA